MSEKIRNLLSDIEIKEIKHVEICALLLSPWESVFFSCGARGRKQKSAK